MTAYGGYPKYFYGHRPDELPLAGRDPRDRLQARYDPGADYVSLPNWLVEFTDYAFDLGATLIPLLLARRRNVQGEDCPPAPRAVDSPLEKDMEWVDAFLEKKWNRIRH